MKSEKGEILELGNVLSNIFPVNHDILDKYDNNPGIINEDVVDFKPTKKYQLIVSISTLEHVGWDETPKEPEKVSLAIENLESWLTEDGMLIFSVPLGYNSYLDNLIKKNKIHLTNKFFLSRISKDNEWEQTSWSKVKDIKYNESYNFANAIMIGILMHD